MRDGVRWYFPGLCGVSETIMWLSRQASLNNLTHVSLTRRMTIVLRRSLYVVVSDGQIFGLFVPLPPPVLIRFTQEGNISLVAGFGHILFLTAVFVVYSRYQCTLNSVPPSIRPMWLDGLYPHTLFLCSKCWILPRPIHPKWKCGPQRKGRC